MKRIGLLLILVASLLIAFQAVHAQTNQPDGFVPSVRNAARTKQAAQPLILIMNASGTIEPAMQGYFQRGIQVAEQRNAEALIIQLDTPGGDLQSMVNIIQDIRASSVPVVIYVTPNGAMAGSAGALITMAAHASAMAPEAAIGASSPIDASGQNLDSTLATKQKEIMKATIRPLVERRGAVATQLAQDMIDNAKAVSAKEAFDAKLIDFIATDTNDLLRQLDGFNVIMPNGTITLHTANAATEPLDMNIIEQLLFILTDSNIVFILLSLGVLALQIELSHPGGWVAGFIGVVCLALALYGMGLLNVNWFGLVFLVTAFILFILDIKAATHGALTAAGIGSFIVGALMLFNSPGVPQFQRVSVPLVVGVGIAIGLLFAAILTVALRARRARVQTGVQTIIGTRGIAATDVGLTGQVQLISELWSAEAADGSDKIGKGDHVEVVQVKGVRLKVRKI